MTPAESKLLEELEISNWSEIEYYDQFSVVMENYQIINEQILIDIFLEKSSREIKEYLEFHFEDLMTGIPNDNMDLYKIFSTVKSVLIGLALSMDKSARSLDNLAYELLRFQTWIMDNPIVLCKDLLNHTKKSVSIYDALIITRMENLKEGSYELSYPDDLDYEVEEYDIDYDALEDDDLDEWILEDMENEEDFPEEYSQGLIDFDNPVIDEM